MKRLKDIIDCSENITIRGIAEDSRLVKNGYLFCATKGYNVDHFDYIDDAINRGCSFIVCDRSLNRDFPHMIVTDINKFYKDVCKKYYGVDLNKYSFIGITGTDGKTTTASIIQKLLSGSSYMGTIGLLTNNRWYKTSNTTPCSSELYHNLERIKNGIVSMEVSSEALLHHRVDDICYKAIGITNITGDHLLVHKSFENYVECKLSLINLLDNDGILVVNGDDPILNNICDQRLIKMGFNKDNDYVIEDVKYYREGVLIDLKCHNNHWFIESPLHGKYNVYNVVMAFIIGKFFNKDDYLLLNTIKRLKPIKGRSEYLDFGQKYDIILDYAHTVNAVKSLLESVQDYDNIIVVTGCAGGRDKDKRPIIGNMVLKMSDTAIFTMDDSRYEDVDDIIDQMAGNNKNYYRIVDREDAIKYALTIAKEGSVVLIIGKGRDDYMAIKDKKIHYCDYDIIHNYFNKN